MGWQLPAVGVVIAAALLYVGRRAWRTWTAAKGGSCGGGCGCASVREKEPAGAIIPAEELKLRKR